VGSVSRFYTDLLWFREIDKTSLFWGMLRTKAFIGLLAGLGTAAIVGVNLWMVERLAPRYGPHRGRPPPGGAGPGRPLPVPAAAAYRHRRLPGLVVGLQASGLWQTFLLWRNRSPSASATPCSTATSASTSSSCRSSGPCSAGCSPPWS
jgi:uncharacterized membrane protein (UPF0182 family)